VPNEDAKTMTLRLLDGTIYGIGGSENAFQKTEFTVDDISLNFTNLGDVRPRDKDPKEMTLAELRQRIADRAVHGQPAYEEQIELHRKFSIPFACIVFLLVGVPLSIPPSRAVRSRGFSMSLALIFLYYIPLTVGQTLAEKGHWPAVVGLWVPNVLFFALGTYLFVKAARETPIRQLERLDVLRLRAWGWATQRMRMLGAS
jgi:lipopolysaccharide export system permease protein